MIVKIAILLFTPPSKKKIKFFCCFPFRAKKSPKNDHFLSLVTKVLALPSFLVNASRLCNSAVIYSLI